MKDIDALFAGGGAGEASAGGAPGGEPAPGSADISTPRRDALLLEEQSGTGIKQGKVSVTTLVFFFSTTAEEIDNYIFFVGEGVEIRAHLRVSCTYCLWLVTARRDST